MVPYGTDKRAPSRPSVTVDVSVASPAGFDDATVKAFRSGAWAPRTRSGLLHVIGSSGRGWIFFDVKMGYGKSYRDRGLLPAQDDVALFDGSYSAAEPDGQMSTDLLLCGSTEHLCRRK
jgi:hypothetical protein